MFIVGFGRHTWAVGRAGFLLAVIDGGGTVPPALGVASDLVGRGHEVRVLGDPTIEQSARAAGCQFTPWTLAPDCSAVSDQTALVAKMESGNPYRRFAGCGARRARTY